MKYGENDCNVVISVSALNINTISVKSGHRPLCMAIKEKKERKAKALANGILSCISHVNASYGS